MEVDAMREVVEIPREICPVFGGWLALSENAARHLMVRERERETQHKLDLIACAGARKLAETERDQNAAALERATWWQRWAPLIIITASGVALVAGAGIGFAVGAK